MTDGGCTYIHLDMTLEWSKNIRYNNRSKRHETKVLKSAGIKMNISGMVFQHKQWANFMVS